MKTFRGALLPELSATVLFCDELRQEASGKFILVGVYGPDIMVPDLPFTLASLSLLINVKWTHERELILKSVRTEIPGHDDFIQALPTPTPSATAISDVDEAPLQHATLKVAISPCRLNTKGRLRVYVNTSQGEVYAGSILVRTAAEFAEEVNARNVDIGSLLTVVSAAYNLGANAPAKMAQEIAEGQARIIASLLKDKTTVQPQDPEQPIWMSIDRRRFWVLYTQPWHRQEIMTTSSMTGPLDTRVVEQNALGCLLELTDQDAIFDLMTMRITATRPPNALVS